MLTNKTFTFLFMLIFLPSFLIARPALSPEERYLRKSKCFKCHSIKKKKKQDGPAFVEIAKKYRDKENAFEEINKHITTEVEVEIDGDMKKHKPIKIKSQNHHNSIIDWILNQ